MEGRYPDERKRILTAVLDFLPGCRRWILPVLVIFLQVIIHCLCSATPFMWSHSLVWKESTSWTDSPLFGSLVFPALSFTNGALVPVDLLLQVNNAAMVRFPCMLPPVEVMVDVKRIGELSLSTFLKHLSKSFLFKQHWAGLKKTKRLIWHISFLFLLFNLLFIYFWLCWVFVAAWGLSLVVVSEVTLRWGAQVSHCSGFSCCGAQALDCSLSSRGTWA